MTYEEVFEGVLLSQREDIGVEELLRLSGLRSDELEELVDFGVIEPLREHERTFSTSCVAVLRTASRLRADFELTPSALALALTYLERIRELEARVTDMECRLLR